MLRPCRFPYACPDSPVRLVKQIHSLVRFSKRTTEHRLLSVPTAGSRPGRFLRGLVCPVAQSPPDFRPYCTPLLGVLFSVRSHYLFAIGLKSYLVLAVNACRNPEGFPTPSTLVLTHDLLRNDTGLSPCIELCSKRLLVERRSLQVSPNTTLAEAFGLDCVAFTHRY